jgi:hypothetical protein
MIPDLQLSENSQNNKTTPEKGEFPLNIPYGYTSMGNWYPRIIDKEPISRRRM